MWRTCDAFFPTVANPVLYLLTYPVMAENRAASPLPVFWADSPTASMSAFLVLPRKATTASRRRANAPRGSNTESLMSCRRRSASRGPTFSQSS